MAASAGRTGTSHGGKSPSSGSKKRKAEARPEKRAASHSHAGAKKSKLVSPATPTKAGGDPHGHRHARKHAESVEQAKRVWNQLRLKTNTPEQTKQYMEELLPLIAGKSHELALQHDGSRCVQAAVQFGTPKQRKQILKEFTQSTNGVADLSKNQYACFAVIKLIKYCHTDPECAAILLKAFRGHVPKLAVHAVASRVIDSIFTTFTAKQTVLLKQEFYGPHFALFATETMNDNQTPTLVGNLAKAPSKKEQTLEFVRSLIQKAMDKTLYGLQYVQELFAEYIAVVDPGEIRQLAATAADHAVHLLASRSGTRVVAALVAYGTAKDRKRILKSLKGYARAGILHADTYLAILRLVQLTDDTVSIQKNLLNELTTAGPSTSLEEAVQQVATAKATDDAAASPADSPLLELALHHNASKLLLLLLMPPGGARDKLLDPYEKSVLFPNPMVLQDGAQVPTSKKDPEVRRKELLEYLQDPLIELCRRHANALLLSRPGAMVLREVYASWHSDSVVTAVVDACENGLDAGGDESEEGNGNLFDDKVSHHSIRNLLLVDAESDKSPLGVAFLERMGDRIKDIASSSRGAFVLVAACKVPAIRQDAITKLKPLNKMLEKQMKQTKNKAGYEALLKEMSM